MNKHNQRKFWAALAAVAILIGASTSARADISFVLDQEFSGADTPSGPVNVLIEDQGDDVKLTVSNGFSSASEFIAELYLNFTGDATALSFSAPTVVGTLGPQTISTGSDDFKADGDGFFDILIGFDNAPPADRFGQGESISWVISSTGVNLDSTQFLALSAGGGNSPDGLYAAAHVQGIGADGEGSGWVTVPEPSTYLAAALLLLPFGLSAIRVLRKQNG